MTTKFNATTSGLIESVDTSGVLEFQTANSSALVIGTDQSANFTGNTALTVPNGTTAQRPTPVNGMMRYNTSLSIFEVYANNTWSAANVTPTPVNTVAPVISGSAIVGQNLTSTTGTWSGSPSAYYYQWLANSTAISNATANVFTLTLAENGANITCNVTAYNVAGNSTPATSNSLGPVIQGVTASYLIVAGGGGGGYNGGGGGGAGGMVTGSAIFQPANTYAITVGAGGIGAATSSGVGNGSNSSITGLTVAVGGGTGGSGALGSGTSGGSGGGASAENGAFYNGSAGTAGQGNSGGYNSSGSPYPGGGGGGAGAAGGNASGSTSGSGGVGLASSISGTSTYYAGGGGASGTTQGATAGSGGNGGGGAGSNSGVGTSGTASTGGGGGGGYNGPSNGGNGGSGIVIISYAGAQQFGGGVISTDGSNTIHTFYTSGSLVPLTALSANYLIVGGGGAGGAGNGGGGGGGAGGLLSGSSLTIDSNSSYAITVGAGGTGASSSIGANGANSTFSAVANAAVGGGGGGWQSVGRNGGSGGGGNYSGGVLAGGTGTAGQGNNGGSSGSGGNYEGGGGGGAGQVGGDGVGSTVAGYGGNGSTSSISGTATYYAGGGGGGTYSGGTAGAGGLGGGGAGGKNGVGTSGTANTGGGGGGGGDGNVAGGSGGSGVVIISYPGSTPMMAGGNVTIAGNTVVHTFTSSGYLTPFVNFNNSLRFRSAASASLSKTYTSAPTSRTTMTFSAWVKRGKLGAQQAIYGTSNNYETALFTSSDTLRFTGPYSSGQQGEYITSQVFRDPAAWYHIVIVYDTTNATAANRMRLFVNGNQVTAFGTQTTSNQNNTTTEWLVSGANSNIAITGSNTANCLDGYMTEVNVIDGQALGPNAFGNFNQYGVWQPVRYSGSYGTNGFYLPFSAGVVSYAGLFNGSSQYLSASAGPFTFGTGDFTLECWIAPTSVGTYMPLAVAAVTDGLWFGKNGSNFVLRAYSIADLLSTPNQPPVGKWTHIAVTRSGSTAYIFFDGILQVSGTVTQNFVSGPSYIASEGSGLYFSGYMSNFRSIKGTALYTANFTPPAAPLTAVSGTSLLTLQNATIVDNGPNAVSITNNGSVTTGQTYPFSAAKIFNDQSPQGNNWNPNNISGGFGSSLDYMVDVPTLTSATAANYCVMNPLDTNNSGITLSNGNLNVTGLGAGSVREVRGTMGLATGKWYFEATVQSSGNQGIGITKTSNSITADWAVGVGAGNTCSYYGLGGSKFNGASGASYGATYTAGDVIGVAYDLTNGSITFYKNGTSQGVAFTWTPDGSYWSPFCLGDSTGTTAGTIFNFGQQPWIYTPPAGYVGLNTYNM